VKNVAEGQRCKWHTNCWLRRKDYSVLAHSAYID